MTSFEELELNYEKLVERVAKLKAKTKKQEVKLQVRKQEVAVLRGLFENRDAEFAKVDQHLTAYAEKLARMPLAEQNEVKDVCSKFWISQE